MVVDRHGAGEVISGADVDIHLPEQLSRGKTTWLGCDDLRQGEKHQSKAYPTKDLSHRVSRAKRTFTRFTAAARSDGSHDPHDLAHVREAAKQYLNQQDPFKHFRWIGGEFLS